MGSSGNAGHPGRVPDPSRRWLGLFCGYRVSRPCLGVGHLALAAFSRTGLTARLHRPWSYAVPGRLMGY